MFLYLIKCDDKYIFKIFHNYSIYFFYIIIYNHYFSELNLNKISNNRENLNLKNYDNINEIPLLKNDTNKAIEFSSNFENTNERKYKRNFWDLFD